MLRSTVLLFCLTFLIVIMAIVMAPHDMDDSNVKNKLIQKSTVITTKIKKSIKKQYYGICKIPKIFRNTTIPIERVEKFKRDYKPLIIFSILIFLSAYIFQYVITKWEQRLIFENPNMLPVITSYNPYLAQLKCTLFQYIVPYASQFGLFIICTQIKIMQRMTNFYLNLLLLIKDIITTHINWRKDRIAIEQGKKIFAIVTNKGIIYKIASQLQIGDHIILNPKIPFPCRFGELTTLGNGRLIFEISSDNGEIGTVDEAIKLPYVISSGSFLVPNQKSCIVKITETHHQPEFRIDEFTQRIINIHTKISIFLCVIQYIFVLSGNIHNLSKKEEVYFIDLISDMISTIMIFNFLIPHMKIIPTIIVRNLIMITYLTKNGLSVFSDSIRYIDGLNHDPYADFRSQILSNQNVFLVSDKTGTITCNNLKILDQEYKYYDVDKYYPNIKHPEIIRKILLSCINDAFLPSKLQNEKPYSFSREEIEISLINKKVFNIGFHNFCQDFGKINKMIIKINHLNCKFFEVKYIPLRYSDSNYGRHCFVKIRYPSGDYVVFVVTQYQTGILRNLLNEPTEIINKKRSLLIAFKQVLFDFENDNFQEYIQEYRDNCIRKKTDWDVLYPLAQFYFDDPIRRKTKEAIRHFQDLNVIPIICTGDHAITASYIGHQIGFLDDDKCIKINGVEFNSYDLRQKNELIEQIIVEKSAIMSQFKSNQKTELINLIHSYLKSKNQLGITMTIGDQYNDHGMLATSGISACISSGTIKNFPIVNCVVDNLWVFYEYLISYRRTRIFGQWWMIRMFHIFNINTSGTCLMGLYSNNFTKIKGVLYVDPWNPIMSIILSNIIAGLLLVLSFKIGDFHKHVDVSFDNTISNKKIFFESICVMTISIVMNYFVKYYVSSFESYSIPTILFGTILIGVTLFVIDILAIRNENKK